jgi:hypothetical protein
MWNLGHQPRAPCGREVALNSRSRLSYICRHIGTPDFCRLYRLRDNAYFAATRHSHIEAPISARFSNRCLVDAQETIWRGAGWPNSTCNVGGHIRACLGPGTKVSHENVEPRHQRNGVQTFGRGADARGREHQRATAEIFCASQVCRSPTKDRRAHRGGDRGTRKRNYPIGISRRRAATGNGTDRQRRRRSRQRFAPDPRCRYDHGGDACPGP